MSYEPYLKILIEEYKSEDVVIRNKAVAKMTCYYSSAVLDEAIQSEGLEFAFDLAKSLLSYYDHKDD